MKATLKYYLLICLSTICSISLLHAQQQIQFSQYVFNGLAVNPAYAGYRGDTYFNSIYRKQWVSLPGAPVTFGASIDGLAKGHNDNVGWGVQLMADNMGPTKTTFAYGNYAFRIQLDAADTRRLCLGIGVGATQYTIDGNVLEYVDNNDNTIPVGRINRIVPDANFGMYYYTPKSYIGLSFMDLLSARNVNNFGYRWNDFRLGSMQRSAHMYLTAGTLFKISDDVKFRPSFLWKEDFWGPSNIDLNAFFLLQDRFWIGASYRTGFSLWTKGNLQANLTKQDAFAGILEFIANDRLRVGYAYDVMLNGLNPYQQGSHEISIGLRLPRKDDRIFSPRYF
jgi:type IX secretion system PorP/SprF family membrane protein